MRVFRKEPVAGVYCFYIGDFCRADDRRDIEVTGTALGVADTNRFVGKTYMQRTFVRFGINGYRADIQFFSGAYDS